ncbi:uncharacterized protein LOC133799411 [Humulus lupulus]|uniref:uncharacterized protein LOC133799411 n=1 Tax=Humulus lupulus TaxID=3486 RepID=UPI002B4060A8|nr:uncharacterized protein LOC133799411 [Humulus lupulus]
MAGILGVEAMVFDEEEETNETRLENHEEVRAQESPLDIHNGAGMQIDDMKSQSQQSYNRIKLEHEDRDGQVIIKKTLNDWLGVLKRRSTKREQAGTSNSNPILHIEPDCVKIYAEDIEEEVHYWNSALVCYVLGANPPLTVMEGFCRRIWKDKGIDKISLLAPGVFILRFNLVETRDGILNGGYQFFDRKPLIMKRWDPNSKFSKDTILTVPVWAQLSNLELNYWGKRSMAKIVGTIGKFVKQDRATMAREKLQFARVLIEVSFTKELPNQIKFEDEKGEYVYVEVHYEWKPDVCMHCRGIGHRKEMCKKKGTQGESSKIWREKKREDLISDKLPKGNSTMQGKGTPEATSEVIQQNKGKQGMMTKNKGIS